MTIPRQVLPGATLMITRRCFGRMLLLTPSDATNTLFAYVLAVAAQRYGILVHALCVMSNHFHCVLTDPLGNLPKFEQLLDGLVARSMNAMLGRWESFWAPGSYSAVRLLSPRDVVQKVAYTLANPVAAGLVRRGVEWPGLWAAAGLKRGEARTVSRPAHFFRASGPLPESATLQFTCPPGFASIEEFRDQVVAASRRLEDRAARKIAAAGRSFMGARVVRAQKTDSRPATDAPRRGLNPRVASGDKWKRIEALTRLKDFVRAYRKALGEFTRGLRDALFPAGTYWMRVFHRVNCVA